MPFMTKFLYSQFFVTPQLPSHDFLRQTVIVTGSNTGLGLEAARHFLNMRCSKLILAVRNISKGEDAKKSLLETSPSDVSATQIEVWPLDLSSSDSVRTFAHRASTTLARIDVLVSNAGISAPNFVISSDGWETTLQTNVISTCLLAVLMLPKMRETGERFKVMPHLVVVTSDTHYTAKFPERKAQNGIMKSLNDQEKYNDMERYVSRTTLQRHCYTAETEC
jgi:retinol dehydrogenase 12